MKTVISINLGNYGSTGTIMREISSLAEEQGYRTFQAYPGTKYNLKKNKSDIVISPTIINKINQKLAYYLGYSGCYAFAETFILLKKIDKIKPDIIHLHNIHDSYINYGMLFKYIKKNNIKVVWTLHDCWPLTGHCAHFILSKCEKWKNGCNKCAYLNDYPQTLRDRTNYLWNSKRKSFQGVKNMVIVTPSVWLGNLVSQSYLKEYKNIVINNGIDLETFRPYVEKKQISKFVILGVSFGWSYKKGIDIFTRLAEDLDSEKFQIVLVGTDEKIEEKLPHTIKTVRKTSSREELARIYSQATLLVNASREENFPTVNIEALACGIPVVTFETGGSSEMINEKTGISVMLDNYDAMKEAIIKICKGNYSQDDCRKRAEDYLAKNKYLEYLHLYNQIIDSGGKNGAEIIEDKC